MFDLGVNFGLTGLIDIGPSDAAKLYVTVRGLNSGLAVKTHDITGPGSNFNVQLYGSNVGGGGEFTGEAKPELSPFPSTLHNLQGTLTLQNADSHSRISFPVLLTTLDIQRNEKNANMWKVSGAWKKNGPYALDYNGTVAYSQPTLVLQETFHGSSTLDPNGLTTHATEVWFLPINGTTSAAETTAVTSFQGSAVAPMTNLKLRDSSWQRLDDAAGMMTVQWGLRSTLDDELFPDINSTRSPSEALTDSNAVIVNDTRSAAVVSNLISAASANTDYLHKIIVLPRTDGKKKVIFKYVNPGVLVTFNARSGARQIKARVSGGNPQLLVSAVYAYSTTRAAMFLSHVDDFTAEVNDFTVYRQVRGTTVPKSNPDTIGGVTLPLIGQTNNASFLGYAAGNVQYAGPRGKVNIGLSTGGTVTFVMFMAYAFHAVTTGIITGVPTQIFGRKIIQTLGSGTLTSLAAAIAANGPTWADASAIGYPGIVQPSQASFAAFTTWSAP